MATNRPTTDYLSIPDVSDLASKLADAVEAANKAAARATEARRDLKEARDELALFEAAILDEAYSTGTLNGKNEEIRERNRMLFLDAHPDYQKDKQGVDYQSRLTDEANLTAEATNREVGMWHSVAHLSTAALQLAAAQVSLQATVLVHPPKAPKTPKAKAN